MKRSAIEESAATDMQQLLKRWASPDFSTNKKQTKQDIHLAQKPGVYVKFICQKHAPFCFSGLEKNSSFVPFSPFSNSVRSEKSMARALFGAPGRIFC